MIRDPAARTHVLFALMIGACTGASPDESEVISNGTTPGPGSIRVMTANVHCDKEDEITYDIPFKTRMARIADLVRDEDPDVVVFTEALQLECIEALRAELRPTYPNFIDVFTDVAQEECEPDDRWRSGLMLFSKHPFEKLATPYDGSYVGYGDDCDWYQYGRGTLVVRGENAGQPFKASDDFVSRSWWYADGDYRDAFAGLVRIKPPDGRVVNVAFTESVIGYTHPWTCYQWQAQESRRQQLDGIRRMIESTLTAQQRAAEPVFLLGVLGIDGNRAPDHDTFAYDLVPGATGLTSVGWACSSTGGTECYTDDNGTPDYTGDDTETCYGGGNGIVNTDFPYGEWERTFANWIEPDALFYSKGTDCLIGGCSTDAFFTDSWAFEHPSLGVVADWGQTDRGEIYEDFIDDSYTAEDNYYVGQTSKDTWHPLTIESGYRHDYILHNQPVDRAGPYLAATHLRRVFFYDPDSDAQDHLPKDYESVSGYENESDGTTTHPFEDHRAISDHYFVVGDFLFGRPPRSSPLPNDGVTGPSFGAEIVQFGALQDRQFSVELTDARQSAWFVLPDNVGTVTPGASDPGVQIDVYHRSDLSTPIPTFHQLQVCFGREHDICGFVHDLPDPPYYVRFSLRPGAAVPTAFAAGFHQHRCTDPTVDFCVLPNGQERSVTWPAGTSNTPYWGTAAYDNQMYFIAAVDKAASNPPVTFRIETENPEQFLLGNPDPGRGARLFSQCGFDAAAPDCGSSPCNAPDPISTAWQPWTDDDGDQMYESVLDTKNETTGTFSPSTPGAPRMVLLRVGRKCSGAGCYDTETRLTFSSRQYRIDPQSLRVLVENDFGDNDDEVYMKVRLDSGGAPGPQSCEADPPPGVRLPYMDPDNDSAPPDTQTFGIYDTDASATTFSKNASITFCESDGTAATADYLGAVEISDQTPLGVTHTETMTEGSVDSRYRFSYTVFGEVLDAAPEQCP